MHSKEVTFAFNVGYRREEMIYTLETLLSHLKLLHIHGAQDLKLSFNFFHLIG